ncbi:hypothetical protein ACTL32_10035 [Planococcus sp. FY231025]|uniref:hypothetical protein n=1 Tax=Planococcus sp. FY231025 TaxID=3455699 RepID=UPI003F8E74F0
MRRSTLVGLIVAMSAFSVYFLVLDPLFADNRQVAFIAYTGIWFSSSFISRKLEGRFAFLDKRMDAQSSVWLSIGVFAFFFLLIEVLS